jgi:hypothetical protein
MNADIFPGSVLGRTGRAAAWRQAVRPLEEGARTSASTQAAYVAAALLLIVVTWPVADLAAGTGTDASWMAALHLAHVRGIHFGPGFVFTYGPLGYLAFPVAISGSTLVQSLLFVTATRCLLAYTVMRNAHRAVGLAPALLVTYVLLTLPLSASDVLPLVVLLYAFEVLAAPTARGAVLHAGLGGIAAGLASLMKLNSGATAAIVVLATAWGVRDVTRRALPLAAAAMAVTFVGCWAAAGNRLTDLPQWLRLSAAIVSGYSGAMQFDDGQGWVPFAALGVTAVAALAAWRRAPAPPRSRRAALLLGLGLFVFAAFKEAVVRQDPAHTPNFFGALAVVFVGLAAVPRARHAALAGIGVCVVVLDVLLLVSLAPIASARHFWDEAGQAFSSGERAALVSGSASYQRGGYGVDRNQLGELEHHTTTVYPYELGAVNAYDLSWRPLPIMQAYAAYTPSLDGVDAAFLASPTAPERILRSPDTVGINRRTQALEAPATFRALLCNYAQLSATRTWQVLAHSAPRCERPRLVASVHLSSGRRVAIPSVNRDELVFVRIHLHDTLWNRIRGFVFKARSPAISVDGAPAKPLVAATAADGIVVRIPASAGYAHRFGGDRTAHTLAVTTIGGGARLDFYASVIRPR